MNWIPPSENDRFSIIVGDGSRIGTELLADALMRHPGLEISGTFVNSADLFSLLVHHKADVVVLGADLDETPSKGFAVCRRILAEYPQCSVVILLGSSTRASVVSAFSAGARGIFCRADSIEALRKCIVSVHKGQVWASSREMHFLVDAFVAANPKPLVNAKGTTLLSKREGEVMRCVTEGLTNREIAERLHLSEHTVKNYIFRIFEKLGVSTRVEMVLYAFSQGAGPAVTREKDGQDSSESPTLEQCRELAEAGDIMAQFRLAEIYRYGQNGVPSDQNAACMWLLFAEKKAAELARAARRTLEEIGASTNTKHILGGERRATQLVSARVTDVPIEH